MKILEELKVKRFFTVKQTLEKINNNAKGMALVIDDTDKLLGTITDGDIRRAILKGSSLDESIENIYNSNCIFVNEKYTRTQVFEQLENKKLKLIPVVDKAGKVIDFLELDDFIINYESNKENYVLIMAGGLGTRLRPLTDEIPKPMLKVGGRPILEIIIEQFKEKGFKNILLSVNYKSEIIENYFMDGKEFGVNIRYIKESKRMGTAGAIRLAEKYLDKPFFVINGDILTNVNFDSMFQFHKENDFSMTIGSRIYEMQIPYGVINADDACITSLEEKPIIRFNVNGGIYFLSPEVIQYIPEDQFFDITELINLLIDNKKKIGSFPIHEYWMDIGKIEDYYKADEDAITIF